MVGTWHFEAIKKALELPFQMLAVDGLRGLRQEKVFKLRKIGMCRGEA